MYFTHHACDELFFGSHRHDEYEVMYLVAGPEETFRLEDREYTIAPRSLLLIPSGRFHSIRAQGKQRFNHLAVHFQKDFLDSVEGQYLLPLFGDRESACITDIPPVIDALMRSIPECAGLQTGLRSIAVKSRVVSLLTEVYKSRKRNERKSPPRVCDRRVGAVLEYVCGNFTKPVRLEDLSRDFAISKNRLNALFREETGRTVGQYIREQRLNFARREIMLGKGPEEAAFLAGFNNYSVFFRDYKALFGCSPTGTRRRLPACSGS